MRICSVEGCGKKHNAKGWCRNHYYLKDPIQRAAADIRRKEYKLTEKGRASIERYKKSPAAKAAARRHRHANPEQHSLQQRKYRETPAGRFKRGTDKEKHKGWPTWHLTFEQYAPFLALPCHYCKGPLDLSGVGLDRKDNERGYEIDNVLPCCGDCNRTRGDRLTVEETEAAIAAVLELRRKMSAPAA